jgi:acetolactate synthase small subunit
MQAFQIRYRNTQGTLMRILNAASRRGLDLPSVQAEPAENDHRATLLLEVNPKQVGQLYREWYAIADVIHVGTVTTDRTNMIGWASPYGPSATGRDEARAARA